MIPQKDIRFVQRKAFKLLSEGKGIDEVKNLVKSEGGDENQTNTLAERYVEDYEFLAKESGRQAKKDGSMYLILGIVFLGGGLIMSLISYFSSNGIVTIFFWGIIFLGLIFIASGVSKRM